MDILVAIVCNIWLFGEMTLMALTEMCQLQIWPNHSTFR